MSLSGEVQDSFTLFSSLSGVLAFVTVLIYFIDESPRHADEPVSRQFDFRRGPPGPTTSGGPSWFSCKPSSSLSHSATIDRISKHLPAVTLDELVHVWRRPRIDQIRIQDPVPCGEAARLIRLCGPRRRQV